MLPMFLYFKSTMHYKNSCKSVILLKRTVGNLCCYYIEFIFFSNPSMCYTGSTPPS